MTLLKNRDFPANLALFYVVQENISGVIYFIADIEKDIFYFPLYFSISGRRKIMSLISGVDSSGFLNTLLIPLNNSSSSTSSQTTESDDTDTEQTTSDSTSTATSTIPLVDQLTISLLQNQYSFMTSLLDSDDSTSLNSSTPLLENSEDANNSQLDQLLAALDLSSSSSGSNDPTASILQSLESGSLSQSDLDSIKTATENLLKSYGSDINSSTQEILNKYFSLLSDTSSPVETTA